MGTEIAIAIVTALVLVAVVGVRTYTGGKIEVKLTDAAIAMIAAGLMLFMTGRISKLVVGSSGVTVETTRDIILAASAQPISKQVSSLPSAALPVVNVDAALKGGIGDIPMLVRREAPALEFVLGNSGYMGSAIQQYARDTGQISILPFCRRPQERQVIVWHDRRRKMLGILHDLNSNLHFDAFARTLMSGQVAEEQATLRSCRASFRSAPLSP